MATNFVKKMTNSALSLLWHSETEWDNALYMQDLMAPLMPLYRKILVKIGPVVSEENWLIKIALRVHVVVRHISSDISRYTGPIFAIFSHMKAL